MGRGFGRMGLGLGFVASVLPAAGDGGAGAVIGCGARTWVGIRIR